MKKILLSLFLTICSTHGFCQQFRPVRSITMADSIKRATIELVDTDNDGLLDVLAFVENSRQESFLLTVKGDTINTPVIQTTFALPLYTAYTLADINHDNRIDLIISGKQNNQPVTLLYSNQGDFSFAVSPLNIPAFSTSAFGDLNQDGRPEWIVSGEYGDSRFLKILEEENVGVWKVVHDSLKINASSLEIVDANGDGYNDIFVSGQTEAGSLFTGLLVNNDKFYFTEHQLQPWAGKTVWADINHDGVFDFVFTGKSSSGTKLNKIFESKNKTFEVKESPVIVGDSKVFVADLNSDGAVDFNYWGKNSSEDSVNVIHYNGNDYDTLISHHVIAQCFGDIDRDGDIDLIQVERQGAIHLHFFENEHSKNHQPGKITSALALTVFNRIFLYWPKPLDDHTPTASLTYDVWMATGSNVLLPASFDLLNEERLTVSHGNSGMNNFRLLQDVRPESFSYAIQPVDNSLYARKNICLGGPGSCHICSTVEMKTISACKAENIQLMAASSSALWFSFKNGFLGEQQNLDVEVTKQDTLFSFDSQKEGCAALTVWTLQLTDEKIKKTKSSVYACEGSTLEFNTEPGWDLIKWQSDVLGDLGTERMVHYLVALKDSISVTLKNEDGCTLIRKTGITISKPTIEVTADRYKVIKGEPVQLFASGASRYQWANAVGLNQVDIKNPTAYPASTIQYNVTGYDSLGCTAQAAVLIVVEDTGFVPTLFTPNNDGINDHLKVYGLVNASRFLFTIYNREGNLVYRATNIAEVNSGWDGTHNGSKQPGGVYFWKVNGTFSSGNKLLLNGKEAGSIVLIR